jgi:hypothetical protein
MRGSAPPRTDHTKHVGPGCIAFPHRLRGGTGINAPNDTQQPNWSRSTRVALGIVTGVGVGVAVLLLAEGLLALGNRVPPKLNVWQRAQAAYYTQSDRNVIQYQPECAEYDAELAYRLKPGSCRFGNREFDNAYRINRIGTRDSNGALDAPEVVFTGDSYAMGWGVEQDQVMSAVLADLTGLRILNTAISSYGTAREMLGLKRVDLSDATTLVIQYCDNDYLENHRFVQNAGALPIMNRERYEARTARHLEDTHYYLGKYLQKFTPLLWRTWRKGETQWRPKKRRCDFEADTFLAVLDLAPLSRRQLRVVVLEIVRNELIDGCFADALRRKLDGRELAPWIERIDLIDTPTFLEATHYYALDRHLTAAGHRRVAEEIARLMATDHPRSIAPP